MGEHFEASYERNTGRWTAEQSKMAEGSCNGLQKPANLEIFFHLSGSWSRLNDKHGRRWSNQDKVGNFGNLKHRSKKMLVVFINFSPLPVIYGLPVPY